MICMRRDVVKLTVLDRIEEEYYEETLENCVQSTRKECDEYNLRLNSIEKGCDEEGWDQLYIRGWM